MKMIGVLGGMGPESTVLFYHELIRQCQVQYGATYDEDYPEIFIYNLPIPDVVGGLKDPDGTLRMLVRGAQKLESVGAELLVMPCNTAHYFYDDMRKELSVRFLSITQETARAVHSAGLTRVGLLATTTTVQQGVYARELSAQGIEALVPVEQESVNQVIVNILAGEKRDEDRSELQRIIADLTSRGAQGIILGCTDLPILLSERDVSVRSFDSLVILAESTIRHAV